MAHVPLTMTRSLIAAPAAPAPVAPVARTRRVSRQRLRSVSVALLLVGTAVLYLWNLSASGWGNATYSAAVQAGSQSWKAFFFGSLDAGNAITVDQPPASLWLMALSVRLFGLSSWSIMVPQALLGVATVGVLYAGVRRTSGHVAGLIAGALLALTPAATAMFRFNHPDALLVFWLTLASYLTLRATERAEPSWLVGAGVVVGFAFLTMMLQAFLVLPALALAYLVAAPTTLRRRIVHLVVALAAVIAALGWWVAVVELVPESWRPYIGGSENNSVLNLVFGHHGLGRIVGPGGGIDGAGGPGVETGTRLFDSVPGGMIGWLIPAALVVAVAALIALRRVPRTNRVRAGLLVWTGWLVVTAAVLSVLAGRYPAYATVVSAPAVAAVIAAGGHVLWTQRGGWPARIALSVSTLLTAGWAYVLLARATETHQALGWPVLVAGVLAGLGWLVVHRLARPLAGLVLGVALLSAGAGPAAYAVDLAATPHQRSFVSSGPASGGGVANGTADAELVAVLETGASGYTWAAATPGAQSAAAYQLATEFPVLAVGGIDGADDSPTLEQFQAYVADGQVHYYVGGGGGESGSAAQIASWVAETFAATVVEGTTIYDLSATS